MIKYSTKWIQLVVLIILLGLSSYTAVHAIEPIDEQHTEVGIVFALGQLTLDYAPNFNFGTQPVSYQNRTYIASSVSSLLQVTDNRLILSRWKVSASLGNFSSGGKPSLQGATLTLNNGTIKATGISVSLPSLNQNIVLPAGGAAQTVEAQLTVLSLSGSWQTTWTANNVSLYVPGGSARTGSNTAVLTWVLQDTP